MLTAINEPFEIDSHKVHISASIRFATYPGEGADAEALIKNADMAMYQVKEQGATATASRPSR